jgi:hypothetical protein
MRLSLPKMNVFSAVSLLIVALLYMKVDMQSSVLFMVVLVASVYMFKCQSTSLVISALVVGLYIMSMKVREGMKNNGEDDEDEDDNKKDIKEGAVSNAAIRASNSRKTTRIKT